MFLKLNTVQKGIQTKSVFSAQGWCTGKTQRDGMEREAGGGDRGGEHM